MTIIGDSSYDSFVAKQAKLFHCNAMPDRWIGEDEEGALVHWPREEGGWAKRTPFKDSARTVRVEVEPALARGTGWFGAGVGRPPRSGAGTPSSPVTIRASAEERAAWEAKAAAKDQSLSEWARDVLNRASK